jgi:DNA-binding transcriptional LysR family regulator
VAEERSFTRAAERLGIGQPAVSEQIGRLERELGVKLLRRTSRKVELTVAGAAFLGRARAAVAATDEAIAAARAVDQPEVRPLRVGVVVTAAVEAIPRILLAFSREQPWATVDVQSFVLGDPSGGLRDGSTDVAFVRPPLRHAAIRIETLLTEPRLAALPADHPLARSDMLKMEQLLGERWIYADVEAVEQRKRNRPGAAALVSSAEGVFEPVRSPLAVWVAPASDARAGQRQQIVYRPISDIEPAAVAIAWRKDAETHMVRGLVDAARRVVAEGLAQRP